MSKIISKKLFAVVVGVIGILFELIIVYIVSKQIFECSTISIGCSPPSIQWFIIAFIIAISFGACVTLILKEADE